MSKRRKANNASSEIALDVVVETESAPNCHEVDLDRERAERILRNQRMLDQLGFGNTIGSLREEAKAAAAKAQKDGPKKRRANQENAAGEERVLRRSLRTKGQEPELPPLLEPLFRRPDNVHRYGEPGTTIRAAKPRAPPAEGVNAAKFDAHNLHRLRTMTDEAMLKRISKITNTLKLQSLVQLLQSFGRDELAEAAQAALDERLACV